MAELLYCKFNDVNRQYLCIDLYISLELIMLLCIFHSFLTFKLAVYNIQTVSIPRFCLEVLHIEAATDFN